MEVFLHCFVFEGFFSDSESKICSFKNQGKKETEKQAERNKVLVIPSIKKQDSIRTLG